MNKVFFKLCRLPIPWRVRYILSNFLSFFAKNKVNISGEYNSPDRYNELKSLKENGYLIVNNFLSETDVDSLIAELSQFDISDPWLGNDNSFKPTMPPTGTHVGYYKKSDLLKIKMIDRIIEDSQVNFFVRNYVGRNYQCTNRASWWTFGNNKDPQEAELMHRDIDNVLWLKIFIYLTDVNDDCGPHVFIPKSHRKSSFLTFRRFTDLEAKSSFGEFTYHTGKRGTMIIEDTFGLHKGQHISSDNNRLIFQLQYSVFKNPHP